MGASGGTATNWIYIGENDARELRVDPKDPDQDQYRNTNVYSRFRVHDRATGFFIGQTFGGPAAASAAAIKSYTGTKEIQPTVVPGGGSTYLLVGNTFELLEVGSDKVKETQTWRNIGAWIDL